MRFLTLTLCLLWSGFLMSQTGLIKGKVLDGSNGSTLPGASVYNQDGKGASTNIDGEFELELPAGKHELTFTFIGYDSKTQSISLGDGQNLELNVTLLPSNFNLDIVVVSAGKFEQDLSEVTVSMDVISPALVENKNTTSMDDLLQQSPGVSIVDGEPQIRSGSGYSFGAGSRVMIMVDDLPVLSGDAGRPTWGFLPVENVEQIEVIKGASSVLYGSAALSGVINIRTAYPKAEPLTKVNVFGGMYSTPQTSEGKYWSGNGIRSGMNFLHSRQIGNLDLVIGGNFLGDDSYLGTIIDSTGQAASSNYNPFDVNRYNADSRARLNVSLRQRSKKVIGLNYGINTSWMKGESLSTLLWDNDTTGLYSAFEGSATRTKQVIGTVDPFVEYFAPNGSKHRLRTRWQKLDNDNDNDQGNFSDVLYGEYQFQQQFDSTSALKGLTLTTGITGTYTEGISQLFAGVEGGDGVVNVAKNMAAYAQLDKRFKDKLTLSAGVRYEYFEINGESESKPVFRSGISYDLGKATFLRASYGQGFRFPTIAEKFINTSVGLIVIYPNETLTAEESWSAEIGIKQGFKIGEFKGFIDLAAFLQEYDNFIEFTFGQWGDPLVNPLGGLGFKSLNTGQSRVSGLEFTMLGTGKIGKTTFNLLSGYTFTKPVSLTPELVYADGALPASYNNTSSDSENDILKYRLQHLIRFDLEAQRERITAGVSARYNDRMQNIDKAFLDIEEQGLADFGLRNWRNNQASGDIVIDLRLGYTFRENQRLMLVVGNLLNREYSIRPLAIESPRITTIQYTLTLK